MNNNRYATALQSLGMEITDTVTILGEEILTATINFEDYSEPLTIHFANNGDALIYKPNGTSKRVCEKSPAQLRRIAEQVIEFYK